MPVWDGNWMWLWEAGKVYNGDVKVIARSASQLNLSGVLVKSHDGPLGSPGSKRFMTQFKSLLEPLKTAGVKAGAWGYVYGNAPEAEAQAAVEALRAGADFYVVDAEAEFERPGGEEKAVRFCEALRHEMAGAVVGLSSFAVTTLHGAFPWATFARYVDAFLPQVYWAAIGWPVEQALTKSVASYNSFNKPVTPVGQAYGPVPSSEIALFAQLVQNKGYAGVSWWSWQHATATQLMAIARVGAGFGTLPANPDNLVGEKIEGMADIYFEGKYLDRAIIAKGKAFVPVRQLGGALGYKVKWQPGRIDLTRD